MRNIPLKIEFTDEDAKSFGLKMAYQGDAGMDLRIILDKKNREAGYTLYPGDRQLFSTGFKMELPEGFWARITHRSSTENKLRLRVIEGTIDQGYRGDLFVQVHNPNTFPLTIKHGDRLAQMIIHEIIVPDIEVVGSLSESTRGANGFGSSGH